MIALKRYKSFAQDLYGFEHLYEMEYIDIKITLTHRMALLSGLESHLFARNIGRISRRHYFKSMTSGITKVLFELK
jgi:hypothetical protein